MHHHRHRLKWAGMPPNSTPSCERGGGPNAHYGGTRAVALRKIEGCWPKRAPDPGPRTGLRQKRPSLMTMTGVAHTYGHAIVVWLWEEGGRGVALTPRRLEQSNSRSDGAVSRFRTGRAGEGRILASIRRFGQPSPVRRVLRASAESEVSRDLT